MPPPLCKANAAYRKLDGVLELTASHLQWTQRGKKAPAVRVPCVECATLSVSREAAAQVKLKVGLVGNDAGHNFTFTSTPQTVALTERESFKRELTNIIARNKSLATSAVPSLALPGSGTPLTASASNAPTPKPMVIPAKVPDTRTASLQRSESVVPSARGSPTPAPGPGLSQEDFRLRKKVLLAHPELATLHRELVMTGQISEAEFWEGRQHLLASYQLSSSQKRGRPGTIVDPRPETVDGDIKIVITPQLVHDIFEEYPVVARAYSENVPQKLTEAEFWKRYFQSKLFNAHRASIRSSAAQHVVKDDPIFDKYLEKDDDDLEPRRLRDERVDAFIDLGATQEDHGETGNERDVTMQAGRQRATLPLIRKFNEHSERLLKSALGDEPPSKKRRLAPDPDNAGLEDYYAQIDLEDLHDPESASGIALEMQDRQRYFEAKMAGADGKESEEVDIQTALRESKVSLDDWARNLTELRFDKKSGEAALAAMTQNVAARLDTKTRKNDIPEHLFRQLTTCQTAANEFLRQFWSAIYPPPSDAPVLSASTPAQKAAKAAKMAGYLSKTQEKVDALVRMATAEGVDPSKVEIAMNPVLNAVNHALAFHRTRQAKTGR
ncbi:hypothetical protein PUNSTDRAFT_50633 [Punctularia strigosozonata HHB-11173 SS5]|uniref:uncharacterized protein n=1 Tax=Punctularia strigosozonata (strain HHB-11173) TaxID=741275 RepID=UPI00044182BE|nr:uncharacterized protein PUNSTDRAFT_50633 [Punctularia strigosozonata HHB-11173 SS5]EIN11764.1 hypothetical protein PUNSTDRAFT_50633 [Punctularia strigosozonata HHB-11173 SS5]